jgi:hypothetical protein
MSNGIMTFAIGYLAILLVLLIRLCICPFICVGAFPLTGHLLHLALRDVLHDIKSFSLLSNLPATFPLGLLESILKVRIPHVPNVRTIVMYIQYFQGQEARSCPSMADVRSGDAEYVRRDE